MERNTLIVGESSSPPLLSPRQIEVTLIGLNLWRQFDAVGTEMVVTKAGRRLFPIPQVKLSGLNPDGLYSIALRLQLVTPERFMFSKHNGWEHLRHATAIDRQQQKDFIGAWPLGSVILHPDCKKLGSVWLDRNTVSFDKVRITNNVAKASDPFAFVVQTNHKYSLVVDVIEHLLNDETAPPVSFHLPYTQFITTSSYQNPAITRLKISHNPLAKAFRDRSSGFEKKRKSVSSVDETSSTNSSEEYDSLSPPAAKRSSPSLLPQPACINPQQVSPIVPSWLMSPWLSPRSLHWYQQSCMMTGQLPYLHLMPVYPLILPAGVLQHTPQLATSVTSFQNEEETEQPFDLSLPKKHGSND